MNSKYLIPIALGLLAANTTYAACTNIPADLTDPNYGVEQWIGGGYDQGRERVKVVSSCLNGEKVRMNNQSAELSVGLLTDYQQVDREINRSSGGKIKIAWFSFGKSRSFVQRITDKAYSQTFVLAFDINTGNGRFDIDPNDPLNNLADRVKHDACEFKKICGDSFVFQTTEGIKLLVAIQISFSTHSHFEEYKNGFSAGLEGSIKKTFNIPGPCCTKIPLPINIDFSGSFSKAVSNITNSLRQQGRIDVFAFQQGGDVAQLGTVLGNHGATGSCSLDNRTACLQMVENALAYIRTPEFIDGAKNDPGVLYHAKRPYWEVDPDVPEMPSEITSEIENARQQLATEFDQRLADQDAINETLNLNLSTERRQQLTQLADTLETETQAIYQTGLICFSDLANCPQKADEVLAGLVAYDRAVVSPNPVDGLVAYYPFDGNALDASENGNDGVVYGASLAKDRFGKLNSAYVFFGAENITVQNNSSFPSNQSLAASLWVKIPTTCLDTNYCGGIISKMGVNENPHQGFQIGYNNLGVLRFEYATNSNAKHFHGKKLISDDEWHHLLVNGDIVYTSYIVLWSLTSS